MRLVKTPDTNYIFNISLSQDPIIHAWSNDKQNLSKVRSVLFHNLTSSGSFILKLYSNKHKLMIAFGLSFLMCFYSSLFIITGFIELPWRKWRPVLMLHNLGATHAPTVKLPPIPIFRIFFERFNCSLL